MRRDDLMGLSVYYHRLFKIVSIFILGLVISAPASSQTIPTVDEINNDIKAFQKFFKKRFPGVKLEDYQDGVNALPQYSHRRKNWELLMDFPPYEQEMEKAKEEWAIPFADGTTFDDCFADKPPGNQYPYFDEELQQVRTIVQDINACLTEHEQPEPEPNSAQMARLVAVYKSKFNGEPMAINYEAEGMREVYEKGRQFYWAKRGQLNLSCASCHVHNAGNRLRSDVLGAALGQTTGFPVYRTQWLLEGQPWGTVHRRYASCNAQVGAAPFALQSDEYIALEVYQGITNTGIPLKVPSQRQ